jgi:hypothetical protein
MGHFEMFPSCPLGIAPDTMPCYGSCLSVQGSDPAQLAKFIVDIATGEAEDRSLI